MTTSGTTSPDHASSDRLPAPEALPDSLGVPPEVLDRGRVAVQRSGPVVTVTLNRPEARNAQTPATWAALAAIGESLPPEVRVVVLRGAGRSFSAGLDRAMLSPQGLSGEPTLVDLAGMHADAVDRQIAEYQRAFTWWSRPEIISVAGIQGHAIGAGFQLALACDLRIVADDAQLAMRETSLGLVPDLTGTGPLVRAVGFARALEICVTGRSVGAQEAVDVGLAQLMVPGTALSATVEDLVVALTSADAEAVRETKRLLLGAGDLPAADQHARERQAQRRRLQALASAFAEG
ncbi:MAG TPA: enoyl-CoA hydratase/isomerase family protein [Actinomycetales bacterium]|nr:enoyl-CoA hydratase/isomerase family protein [Actinomycetales bacterium]